MTMKLNVVCVLVRANVDFTAEYVRRLKLMVERNLPIDHNFVCLTDEPHRLKGISGIYIYEIPSPGKLPGWWSKLELFNPEMFWRGQRCLYLDLDVLVVKSLLPIAEYTTEFALVPPAGNWQGRNGLTTVRRYNSSVMLWTVTKRIQDLYLNWRVQVAERLWGDQDWIGEQYPDANTMPIEWFPRISEIVENPKFTSSKLNLPKEAVVVLCKKPKNHEAFVRWPWFDKVWR